MSNPKFKNGDRVGHKSTDKFEMVVIGNCFYKSPTQQQLLKQELDPNLYNCKYYNPDTKKWEEECFEEFELELLDD